MYPTRILKRRIIAGCFLCLCFTACVQSNAGNAVRQQKDVAFAYDEQFIDVHYPGDVADLVYDYGITEALVQEKHRIHFARSAQDITPKSLQESDPQVRENFEPPKGYKLSGWSRVLRFHDSVLALLEDDPSNLFGGFSLFENRKLLWDMKLFVGAELEATVYDLNGDFALQIQRLNEPKEHPFDVYFRGKFLSEQFNIDGVARPFLVDGKLGFFAQENGTWFLVFDGKRASKNFDYIRIHTCCMVMEYPFEVFSDGIVQFVARREGKLYWVRVDTNKDAETAPRKGAI